MSKRYARATDQSSRRRLARLASLARARFAELTTAKPDEAPLAIDNCLVDPPLSAGLCAQVLTPVYGVRGIRGESRDKGFREATTGTKAA